MKLAYFDCFSGISGDMTLGALVDAGLPIRYICAPNSKLYAVPGWEISAEKVWKNGIAATTSKVTRRRPAKASLASPKSSKS